MKRIASILVAVLLMALAALPAYAQSTRQPISAANASTLEEVFRLGRGTLEHVEFSPDGKTILLGGGVGVFFYESTALNTESEPPLIDPNAVVRAMDLSPDGSLLAISGSGQVVVYDANTRELVQDTQVTSGIDLLRFTPDSTYLVMVSSTKGVIFYDLSEKTIRKTIEGRFATDGGMAISPDGQYVAVTLSNYIVQLFDLKTLDAVGNLEGHTAAARDAAFSPDGKTLATVARDNSLRLWNVADQKEILNLNKNAEGKNLEAPYAVAFSPDGKTIVTGHSRGILRLWDATTGAILKEASSGVLPVLDVAYSTDGETIAAVYQPSSAALWDAQLAEEITRPVGHIDQVFSLDFTPDQTTLAIATRDWNLYLWDVLGGKELHFSPVIAETTASILGNRRVFGYSPDGSVLATVTPNATQVTLHNPHTGELLTKLETTRQYIVEIAFSPDSTLIALGSNSGGVAVYEVKSGKLLVLLDNANATVTDLVWSSDQTMLASGSEEGAVRIFALK